jgi:formylglycine-generating enzyme required for sulfatase activity
MAEMRTFAIVAAAALALAGAGYEIARIHSSGSTQSSAACRVPDRAQVFVPGGTFQMGSTEYYAEEGPVRRATVAGFWMDRTDVTNAEFAKFVAATGYVTDADRKPDPKDYPDIPADKLQAGGAIFTSPTGVRTLEDPNAWWAFAPGADWRHPDGPGSTIVGHDNDPVVQVSYNDALAYANWAGRELPTEEQYEYAARGGLDGKTYAWGDEFEPGGKYQANTWQGTFPNRNEGADGYIGRAPVGCFPANGYGLYDMTGNVWKWTSTLYGSPKDGEMPMAGMPGATPPAARVLRTIKGGSFLCAPNYCRRYRPAAREAQETSFSAAHLGFRTVKNSQ